MLTVNLVVVPGNHDCCFDEVKATRKVILRLCRTDTIEEKDFIDEALTVQDNYWSFHNELGLIVPDDKISFKYTFRPHIDYNIVFHCYNTSWMTEINETPGSLIMPENRKPDNA